MSDISTKYGQLIHIEIEKYLEHTKKLIDSCENSKHLNFMKLYIDSCRSGLTRKLTWKNVLKPNVFQLIIYSCNAKLFKFILDFCVTKYYAIEANEYLKKRTQTLMNECNARINKYNETYID